MEEAKASCHLGLFPENDLPPSLFLSPFLDRTLGFDSPVTAWPMWLSFLPVQQEQLRPGLTGRGSLVPAEGNPRQSQGSFCLRQGQIPSTFQKTRLECEESLWKSPIKCGPPLSSSPVPAWTWPDEPSHLTWNPLQAEPSALDDLCPHNLACSFHSSTILLVSEACTRSIPVDSSA